ncbi:MAG TPA: galactokinase, partial [Pyrinomonadaceae bacterium]|nr:galactokinase [Pyrinomonadaceae bacterium]
MVDLQALRNTFRERYETEPRLFSAPGRVNLIGEHTDYNAGFVLPIAANLRTYVAAAVRSDHSFRVYSCNLQDEVTFQLGPLEAKPRSWINYVYGVSQVLKDAGHDLKGVDVVIASEVIQGAGLSSSAALEVSFGFALLTLNAREIDPLELAHAAQSAEHSFVGTKSGLMDQLTAIFAKSDHALLIDCRSLQITAIPLRMDDLAVVICDSKVKHELATSAYNQRRAECEQAVELLGQKKPGINSLRDLTAVDIDLIETLPEPMRRRARHVISEHERTLLAAEAIKVENFQLLGEV